MLLGSYPNMSAMRPTSPNSCFGRVIRLYSVCRSLFRIYCASIRLSAHPSHSIPSWAIYCTSYHYSP